MPIYAVSVDLWQVIVGLTAVLTLVGLFVRWIARPLLAIRDRMQTWDEDAAAGQQVRERLDELQHAVNEVRAEVALNSGSSIKDRVVRIEVQLAEHGRKLDELVRRRGWFG